ncbi:MULTISPECIES: FAD-containing oxidoreductase [Mycobacterium avium complex (MAC)]|uniref:FAD-containing oxidoreductase n=8 Tax=Mycobacterium avium complex (MAC) TaxID=120793 RepID=A0AAW5RZS4_MYCBC|nr:MULTISPECIES: FAD-containing oxidoreductase [Mycobacterium avium complex (MAC)]ETB25368.1 mercuric reductase [Mycobacterium avium 09-5983]APA75750.1 FAD-containing oxidoreductase [Mycobacterium avium subsp. hominissuis]APT10967.1 mercuric reductase [Mycobacterium avium subsp. hominissuis]ETZ39636.1 pyridine nucleotide-disulfide oxidoreductase family protein [Mycobacterium avium MAV_120809_2495]ETZ42077.1 pyridine nucleotide-disulfide oxidoreductase family protein [Mycobacterium avium MAV_12
MTKHFDAIIVGAGQAGPPLAGRLTAAGQRVAIIERKLIGGTCVNTGCIPTKTLVASAHAAHLARRGADYGVGTGAISVDMAKVKARKDEIMLGDRKGVEDWLAGMAGCTVVRGHARFRDPHTLQVGEDLLRAERIFLNVGGRAVVPDIPGLAEVDFLTNVSILELDTLPTHLVIVGGSYIALEFAQMYRRFGAAVTVVERGPRLASREDEDVSAAVQEILRAEGIDIVVNADDVRIAKTGNGFELAPRDGAPSVRGSHLLLAVGRRPNTDDLDLAAAGVRTDARGYILVDDQLKTNVEHIWAMGDCNGRGAFTHTSYNDFEIVAANLLDDDPRRVSDRITTYALYIDPPLGRAGMTVAQVRASGRRALVGKRPMTRVGRAVEKGETQGFMKVVVDADTREILGAAILGVGGDEAIHGILDVMSAKAPYTTLSRTMHIHPTVSELIPTMLQEMSPLA